MDVYEFPYKGKPLDSLIENALNGGVHSQATLAEYYAAGYQVPRDFYRAYSWAFVAKQSGYHSGEFWEKEIWCVKLRLIPREPQSCDASIIM